LRTKVLLLLLLLVLSFFSMRLVFDDLWMHLAVGKLIVDKGAIPTSDEFTFVENDRPWVPHLWLSSILMYLAYEAGAMEGIRWFFLITTFLYLACVALYYRVLGLNAWSVALGVCFVFALSMDRFRHRPIIFEMMFLYGSLALLLASWPRLSWRHLLAIYLLTALFVNLHSGCLIVPVLLCAWVAGDLLQCAWRRELPSDIVLRVGVAVAALLGSLTNPHHVQLWIYIFGAKPMLSQVPEYNSTWIYFRNDNFATIPNNRIPMVVAPWLVMLLLITPCLAHAATLLWAFLKRRLRWRPLVTRLPEIVRAFPLTLPELFLCLPLLYLSVRHVRFLYMVGVPLGLFLSHYRTALADRRGLRWCIIGLTTACLIFVILDRKDEAWFSATHPDEPVKQGIFPLEATRFLEERQATGRVFADPMGSTYLLWRLYPRCRTFYDMRHIYGGKNVFDQADEIRGAGPRQGELLDRYKIDIIVSRAPFPFTDAEQPKWRLAFKADSGIEHVYLRRAVGGR